MAVEGKSRRTRRSRVKMGSEAAKLKAQLMPPEEQPTPAAAEQGRNNGGAIVVDTSSLKVPRDFTEEEEEGAGLFHLEPVTLVILILALSFIAFIAYLISITPE
ncbi:MAG: hypothetical protein WBP93_17480 [Pyrinomonadaceae bacterium]